MGSINDNAGPGTRSLIHKQRKELRSCPHLKPQAAFTIIELLVVIGIIGLIAALSVPALIALKRGQRLKNTGRMVQTMLSLAKQKTVSRPVRFRVVFFADRMVLWHEKYYRAGKLVNYGWEVDSTVKFDQGITYTIGWLDGKDREPKEWDPGLADDATFLKKYSLGFRRDGSMDFNGYISVPREYVGYKGTKETEEVPPQNADLIFSSTLDKEKCWVDIDHAGGRVYFRIAMSAEDRASLAGDTE